MREDAWKEISEKMQFSVATLKEKMKILMGTYRSEKSRMNKRRGRGSGKYFFIVFNYTGVNYYYYLLQVARMCLSLNGSPTNILISYLIKTSQLKL